MASTPSSSSVVLRPCSSSGEHGRSPSTSLARSALSAGPFSPSIEASSFFRPPGLETGSPLHLPQLSDTTPATTEPEPVDAALYPSQSSVASPSPERPICAALVPSSPQPTDTALSSTQSTAPTSPQSVHTVARTTYEPVSPFPPSCHHPTSCPNKDVRGYVDRGSALSLPPSAPPFSLTNEAVVSTDRTPSNFSSPSPSTSPLHILEDDENASLHNKRTQAASALSISAKRQKIGLQSFTPQGSSDVVASDEAFGPHSSCPSPDVARDPVDLGVRPGNVEPDVPKERAGSDTERIFGTLTFSIRRSQHPTDIAVLLSKLQHKGSYLVNRAEFIKFKS